MQVRRQDKYRETPFIEVGKYVNYILEYYKIQEAKKRITIGNKSVFVATDEPQVLTELNLRFPQLQWLSRAETATETSILQNRYSNQGWLEKVTKVWIFKEVISLRMNL